MSAVIESPRYSLLVLVLRERPKSVASPGPFRALVRTIEGVVSATVDCDLKCRGDIEDDAGKNWAPRASRHSLASVDKWAQKLEDRAGRFLQWELFDAVWLDARFPTTYASIVKRWWPEPGARTQVESTKDGMDACVTIAIPANAKGTLDEVGQAIALEFAVSCGFVEDSVTWDQPSSVPGFRTGMIDVRWSDLTKGYNGGQYSFDTVLPRLFPAMIVSEAHLRLPLSDMPQGLIAHHRPLHDRRHFIRFAADPRLEGGLSEQIGQYFHLLPREKTP